MTVPKSKEHLEALTMSSTHGAVLWQLNETISHQIQFLLVNYLEQEKMHSEMWRKRQDW